MLKDMIKTGLFLLVFAALSGLMLAFCESYTAPEIEKIKEQKASEAMSKALPSANNFEPSELGHIGKDKSNNVVGMVIKTKPKSYGKELEMLVGIENNGKVSGVEILSHSETPGLGAKVTSDKFKNNFSKLIQENPNPIFKIKKEGGDVDAITAATITSKAFCKGINEALDKYKMASNGGNK